MSDILCRKCGEPWEYYYLQHEGLYDPPGRHAPQYLIEVQDEFATKVEDFYDNGEEGEKPEHDGTPLVNAVVRGEGCPSCWHDPSRARLSEEGQLETLRHNLFDSNWDGDPAELF